MSGSIAAEVAGLYRVVVLDPLRRTPGVKFDVLPPARVPRIDAVDRVIHVSGAISPGPVGGVERPWYMHTAQDDNLLVLAGVRHVEIYTHAHGRIERFDCGPDRVEHNGRLLCDEPCMLVWPRFVFHRIVSDAQVGSASVNLATHYPGFDIRTNFSIYDVDLEARTHRLLREGYRDQASGASEP